MACKCWSTDICDVIDNVGNENGDVTVVSHM